MIPSQRLKMMKYLKRKRLGSSKGQYWNPVLMIATMCLVGGVFAETFPLPPQGDDLIGRIRHTKAHQEDTLIDIARRFSVGQDEMVMANQNVDRWLPKEGTDVLIPQEYILPEAPRNGIVVNIPEMRLYYFPVKVVTPPPPVRKVQPKSNPSAASKNKPILSKGLSGKGAKGKETLVQANAKKAIAPPAPVVVPEAVVSSAEIITYPVSMGRMDWRTPIGKTSVVRKQKDPSWTPPASIKREHAAKGDPLPDVVPPGPNNPLGKYAMSLGVSGYLIHGTDAPKSDGIGMRVTHGCMRMYNEDIEKLFPLIPVGAPVYLVNQPVKFGWRQGVLYMEVSQPLDEDVGISPHDVDLDLTPEQLAREDAKRSSFLMKLAMQGLEKQRARGEVEIKMDKVRRAIDRPTGIPVAIGGQGAGWEEEVSKDTGIAPPPKPKLSEELQNGGGKSSSHEAEPAGHYEQDLPPLDDQGGSSYGGISEAKDLSSAPVTQGNRRTPITSGLESAPPLPTRPQPQSSGHGVTTTPYGSENDPEEE